MQLFLIHGHSFKIVAFYHNILPEKSHAHCLIPHQFPHALKKTWRGNQAGLLERKPTRHFTSLFHQEEASAQVCVREASGCTHRGSGSVRVRGRGCARGRGCGQHRVSVPDCGNGPHGHGHGPEHR